MFRPFGVIFLVADGESCICCFDMGDTGSYHIRLCDMGSCDTIYCLLIVSLLW